MPGSCQTVRKMNGLAARSGTNIYNIIARLWICNLTDQHGADILYRKQSLPETFQIAQIVISGNAAGIRQVRMAHCLHPFFFQPGLQFRRLTPAGITADCQRLLLLEICKHHLHSLPVIFLQPLL